MFHNVGFIGCGNMGSALASAVAAGGESVSLRLSNRTHSKAEALAEKLGAKAVPTKLIAADCDLIFLGVKPQMMPALMSELEPLLRLRHDRFVLVTMAASLTTADIRRLAGGDYPVIRIMPNTPVAIGEGVVQMCSEGVTDSERDDFKLLMRKAGLIDELPEPLIDAASSVSGCGPAFACMFIEALADGGVACGLPRDKAMRYAAQMLAGTAKLYLESGEHPGAMKDRVCSPGGTTIQGVRALERGGFRSAVFEAVTAAYEKTEALKKG
jgi:pyrroline-5-carboxylate reductase